MIHLPPNTTRTCTYIRDNSEGNKTNKQTKKKVNNAIYTKMKIKHKLWYSLSLSRQAGKPVSYCITLPPPLPPCMHALCISYTKIKHQLCYSLSLDRQTGR